LILESTDSRMFRIKLDYSFTHDGAGSVPHLDNALFTLLRAIRDTGSITRSAVTLGLSYRHVWGELKRWETALDHSLIDWAKGRRARLSPFGERLLWAEERARARIAPEIQSLAAEMERAFAVVFDASTHVVPVCASHDLALPLLRDELAPQGVHLDLRYAGSLDALAALTEGRAMLAGFHVNDDHPAGSITARAFKRALTPGKHKLIDFARRRQGFLVPPGNPQRLVSLIDLTRNDIRFVNRKRGSGTRIELDQLLGAAHVNPATIRGYDSDEATHLSVAVAVA
jgi:putative molybdopterin biosynthesis protein